MRRTIQLLLSVWFISLIFSGIGHAQLHTPKIKLDSNRILIGDQIHLNIELLKTKTSKVTLPAFGDTLTQGIEIIEFSGFDTIEVSKELEKLEAKLLITSFDSGFYEIKPLNFKITEGNFTDNFYSRAEFLQVMTLSLDSGSNAIFDIKPPVPMPVTFKEVLPWIGIVYAILAIITALVFYFERREQNKPIFKREKPKDPAHVIAFRDLSELEKLELWQKGQVKEYYSELTEVFRTYLENKFDVMAMEQTSYEIIEEMKNLPIEDEKLMKKLGEMLQEADLVKFAKANPSEEENEQYFKLVYNFVDNTKEIISQSELAYLQKEEIIEINPEENASEPISEEVIDNKQIDNNTELKEDKNV